MIFMKNRNRPAVAFLLQSGDGICTAVQILRNTCLFFIPRQLGFEEVSRMRFGAV